MPDIVHFDTTDLARVTAILNRRAAFMVRDLVNLGRHSADDYALAGGRHRHRPGRYTYLRRRGRRVRMRQFHATGAQQARMIEHVAHRGFLDFFGPWVLCLFVASELAKVFCSSI
jgi:hypothetical protein